MATAPHHSVVVARAERRIGRLTLGMGLAAAVVAAAAHSPLAGVGVAGGAILAWLNYLWLHSGVAAIATLSVAQAGAEKPRISRWVWVRMLGRYALMAAGAYAMISHLHVPVWSVFVGLLSLGAAAISEAVWELAAGADRLSS